MLYINTRMMDPTDLARWTLFALRGGFGKCVAVDNCAADHRGCGRFYVSETVLGRRNHGVAPSFWDWTCRRGSLGLLRGCYWEDYFKTRSVPHQAQEIRHGEALVRSVYVFFSLLSFTSPTLECQIAIPISWRLEKDRSQRRVLHLLGRQAVSSHLPRRSTSHLFGRIRGSRAC